MEHMAKCDCGKEVLANSYTELLELSLEHEVNFHS